MQCAPFSYFITLTFRNRQSEDESKRQINFLLHLLKQKVLGRKSDGEYLNGFCAFEKHRSFANNELHCHILLCSHDKLDCEGKKPFSEHFYECLGKVNVQYGVLHGKDIPQVKAFAKNCCDITVIYDLDGLVSYFTKTFERNLNLDAFQPIGKYGIQ